MRAEGLFTPEQLSGGFMMSFEFHEHNGLLWLDSTLLGQDDIRHGFSTRTGGVSPAPMDSLNLATGRGDGDDCLRENYRRFCALVGTDMTRLVMSNQVHETTVRLCTASDAGKGLYRPRDYAADALITNEPDLPLVVFSADCGIILLHDPVNRAIGAIHSGWRSCAGGIVEKTVQAMQEHFGSDPRNITAAIGPCIGQCCFETDSDVADAMLSALGDDALPYLTRREPKWHVDLAGLNRQWLLRAGLLPEQIDTCGLCTACRPDLFWSHRKMGNARGGQIAMIALT